MGLENLAEKLISIALDLVKEFLEAPAPLLDALTNGNVSEFVLVASSFAPHIILASGLLWMVLNFNVLVLYSFSGLVANMLLNIILKDTIQQPRPSNSWKSGYGMPSEHAQFMGFICCFSLLIYGFLQRHRQDIILPHPLILVLPVCIPPLVSYSRVAIGVHSTVQVVVGFLFGFFFAYCWYHLGVIIYSACYAPGLFRLSVDESRFESKKFHRGKWTVSSLQKEFYKLGYNMLDTNKAAKSAYKNPARCYKELKDLAHQALATGRDNVDKGNLSASNSNFAYAYQMRCVCDWIWRNLLGREGDQGHAAYLQLSRKFGKLCAGKAFLSAAEKAAILKQISAIRD